ncbi:hypothetical protein ACI48D_20050 [Massilia sp. LXY-6]|uniref:hypothetical protein n=1 Tax=Massilia sp. LXY-6 TaxID=3379823 RepID=UPI003EDF470E
MQELKSALEARARSYQHILQEEGYRARDPEWDAESSTWDVYVKFEGASLLIVLDLDDAHFVRILLPNFYKVEPSRLDDAMLAIDLANKKCKCAKVYLNAARDNTVAAVEFLDPGEGGDRATLLRYLAMAVNAAKFYAHHAEPQLQDT